MDIVCMSQFIAEYLSNVFSMVVDLDLVVGLEMRAVAVNTWSFSMLITLKLISVASYSVGAGSRRV